MTIAPDGSLGFGFSGGFSTADVHATIEHLLSLPAQLIALMRSVFQEQTDVAHVYAGSRRHMMRQIFSDENEPF